ncbi:MAG: molecular chaperone HtpG, partial [Blastocatellia bacterium]
LGTQEERKEAEEGLKEQEKEASGLLEFMQKHLDRDVKQVRLSTRLVASPVCLVGTEIDYSPQMERLLQMGKGGGPKQRRIMEINPKHEIFVKMLQRYQTDPQDSTIGDYSELLLGYGLLAEGSELPDPARFNKLIADVLVRTL